MQNKTRIEVSLCMMSVLLGGCSDYLGEEVDSPTTGTTNNSPVISGTQPTSVTINETYTFTPSATDSDGDVLTFSIQNMPAWASFDTSTGTLSGTPIQGDEGTYSNIVINATDGQLSASLPAFAIQVNQVGLGSATLSWTAPVTNSDGSPLTDLAGYKLYYGTSQGSYGYQIQIDNPGITAFVVENLSPNTYYFVAAALNSAGVESNYSNEAIKTIN